MRQSSGVVEVVMPGKREIRDEVLDVCRLGHDVCAREIVAALLDDVDQQRGGRQ